jgi:Protein of unknown function (DUF2971)
MLTDDVYHYTSAEVGIDSVLCQMQFRMGLLESTNDPRESRPHYPPFRYSTDPGDLDLFALWAEADNLLRRQAKVACFTLDYKLPEYFVDADALRGYAHPALWAHYGGRHSGVCLRFSKSRLTARIGEELADRGRLFEGPVTYVGDGLQDLNSPEHLDLQQVCEFGLDAVVANFIERNHQSLFFRKHLDWSNEHEYRWILVEPGPLPVYVDVHGCLTGVVVGDAFPMARLSAVHHLASKWGDLEVSQAHFDRGRPTLRPPPRPSPGTQVSPGRPGSYGERVRALAEAEAARAEAESVAKAAVWPLLPGVETAIWQIVAKGENLPEAEATFQSPSVDAIPVAQRRTAAGVSEQSSVYDRGAMCVIEALPKHSFTLVLSIAVQVFSDGTMKWHAAIVLERWLPTGNTDEELWRLPPTVGSVEGCAQAIESLGAESDNALRTFNQARGRGQ